MDRSDREHDDDAAGEVVTQIRWMLASGLFDADEIIRRAVRDGLESNTENEREAFAVATLREAVEAHVRAEQSWPELTDVDRLERAFDELNIAGIVARHNVGWDSSDVVYQQHEEIERLRGLGESPRGSVAYHEQDLEVAVADRGLDLRYGAVGDAPDYEAATAVIAQEVVAALARNGLTPTWSGEISTTISLPMTWRRRVSPAILRELRG
jgi:hypothetical protein